MTGNALYLVSQFGVLTVLAHLTNPETVGSFGYALALSTPIVMLTNLGLQVALATDANDKFSFGEYAMLRAAGTAVALIALVAVGVLAFEDRSDRFVFAAVAAAKLVETYSDLCYGQFQKLERLDLMARSQILRGPATLVLFSMLLWWSGRPELALTAQFVVWLSVALLHDRRIVNRCLPATETRLANVALARVGALAREVWPLGVNALAAALSNNAPRAIVKMTQGLAAAGHFTAISYILYAGMFFANALGAVIAPRLSRAWSSGDHHRYRKLVLAAVILGASVGALGCLVGWVGGRQILTLAFGSDYAEFRLAFTLALAALGLRFVAVALQTAISAQRRFGSLGWLQTLGLVVTLMTSWIGASYYDLVGASIALAVAAGLQVIAVGSVLVLSLRRDGTDTPSSAP